MIASFFFGGGKDFARFGIVLPFAFGVVFGHETLFAHKKQRDEECETTSVREFLCRKKGLVTG